MDLPESLFTRAERTAQPLPKWPVQLQSRKSASQNNSTKSVPEQVPDTVTCILQGFQVDLQPLVGQNQVEKIKRRRLGRGRWRLQGSLGHHAGTGLTPTPLALGGLHPATVMPDICVTRPRPNTLLLALFHVVPTISPGDRQGYRWNVHLTEEDTNTQQAEVNYPDAKRCSSDSASNVLSPTDPS